MTLKKLVRANEILVIVELTILTSESGESDPSLADTTRSSVIGLACRAGFTACFVYQC